MRTVEKVLIFLLLILSISITTYSVVKMYFASEDAKYDIENRVYMTKHTISLLREIEKHPKDVKSREQLGDVLYFAGIYRSSANIYNEAYLLSVGPSLSTDLSSKLKDKRDKSQALFNRNKRDQPDRNRLNIDQIQRLYPNLIVK